MTIKTNPAPPAACAVNRHVPFVHVGDVEASLDFYALLGFVPESVMKDGHGRAFWALAKSGKGEIMFARASGPVDAEQQAVLFYMYSTDVAGLRRHLLENGVRDGGAYCGAAAPGASVDIASATPTRKRLNIIGARAPQPVQSEIAARQAWPQGGPAPFPCRSGKDRIS